MDKLRVAIIGQGRSGRNIHGHFFKSEDNTFCEVVAIVEEDAFRRERAKEEFGCDVYASVEELYGRTDIDVVTNASYSDAHYSITKALLEHGFNVISEKPFGRTYHECMDLALTAKTHGVTVTAFHQSLYAPSFRNVKDYIASGKLGDVLQINLKYSKFARRWDWQTLQARVAGGLYNTGPHPVGQALEMLDWDERVQVIYSSLRTVIDGGDSDDYAKLLLTAPGKPLVDIEVISSDAFASDYVFKIYGSRGTLISTNEHFTVKYIDDPAKYPDHPVVRSFMADETGEPVYCSEKYTFIEESGDIKGSSFDVGTCTFYRMMYATLKEGKPLQITPEHAALAISIIERAHAENPLPVKYL